MKRLVPGLIAALLMVGVGVALAGWTTTMSAFQITIDENSDLIVEVKASASPVIPSSVFFVPSGDEFTGDLSGAATLQLTVEVKDVVPKNVSVSIVGPGKTVWNAADYGDLLVPNTTTVIDLPLDDSTWTGKEGADFAATLQNVQSVRLLISARDGSAPPYQYVKISNFVLLDDAGGVLFGPASLTPVQAALQARFGTSSEDEFYRRYFAAEIVEVAAAGVTIKWPAINGKSYAIMRSGNLTEGFSQVGEIIVADGDAAVYDILVTDESAEPGVGYSYRVYQLD